MNDANGHLPHLVALKNYKCKRCGHVVGQTDGVDLVVNDEPFPLKPIHIMFNCPRCNAEVRWNSTRNRKALREMPR